MNLIVAVDNNWAIGKDNTLLYHLPKDLEFFKTKTLNKVVVMGEKTFLSLPKQKPLKNRINIVVSNSNLQINGAQVVNSLESLFEVLKNYNSDDIFVIGGQMLYEQLLPYCSYAYITKINASCEATKFFPNISNLPNWQLIYESQPVVDNNLTITFTTYKNLNPKPY